MSNSLLAPERQGGEREARGEVPTTHSNPTFKVDGVVHYCVANMPGGVPRTSTFALTNVTLPYLLLMANRGLVAARRRLPSPLRRV